MGSRVLLAAAIVFATLVGAWISRSGSIPATHRNRFIGAVCFEQDECWFRGQAFTALDGLGLTHFAPLDAWPGGSGVEVPGPALSRWPVEGLGEGEEPEALLKTASHWTLHMADGDDKEPTPPNPITRTTAVGVVPRSAWSPVMSCNNVLLDSQPASSPCHIRASEWREQLELGFKDQEP